MVKTLAVAIGECKVTTHRSNAIKLVFGSSFAAQILAVINMTSAQAQSLACDDGIKTAFHPDDETKVVAVR
jgi:hypothetical protein